MPAKESFSRRILMPMSMHIQFPLQFNAYNVRLVVTGSCVTLFKGQIPYGELIISFERSKISFKELKISFERSKIPFGERIVSFRRAKILFKQNVCGKRYQLNPFSPVFCAKIFTKFSFLSLFYFHSSLFVFISVLFSFLQFFYITFLYQYCSRHMQS